MWTEKGVDYYLHHFAFHILLGLFIAIGLLSIYPTVIFLRWGKDTRAGNAPIQIRGHAPVGQEPEDGDPAGRCCCC